MFILFILLFHVVDAGLLIPDMYVSEYGKSLAVYGDWAVVGASNHAYVFKKDNDDWIFTERLGYVDGSSTDRFGYSVAIDADFLVVSAPYQYNFGRVYVYQLNDNSWSLVSVLKPPVDYEFGKFGHHVSIEDNWRIVVGHPGANYLLNYGIGLVNVYHRVSYTSWYLTNSIHPTGTLVPYSYFGSVVYAHGNFIAIGAPYYDQGIVYLFEAVDFRWHLRSILRGDGDDSFGKFVGFTEDKMVIASNSKLFMYRNYDSLDMVIDQRVFSMAVAKHLVVVSYDSKISTYKYMHGRWALVETIETDRTFTSLSLHDTELLLGEPNSRTVFYMSEYYFTDIPTASPTISPTASPQAPTTGIPTVSPTLSPTAQVIVLSENIVYSFIAALILLVLGCAFIFYYRKPIIEDVAAPHI